MFQIEVARFRAKSPHALPATGCMGASELIARTSAVVVMGAVSAWAGARIDLRPTPPMPPGGYAPESVIHVDLVIVDTGNPQGNILFRGLFFDFADTSMRFSFPGPDGLTGSVDDNQISWRMPVLTGPCGCVLPNVAWLYPLPLPNPALQFVLPDDGEVPLLYFNLHVGDRSAILDVMNADEGNPNLGAYALFGFGGAGDPITTWRAFTGELTGGRLEIVVNEGDARRIVSSTPASLSIDARQPSDIAGQNMFGWTSVDLIFDGAVPLISPQEFYVTQQGGGGPPPGILSTLLLNPNQVRVTFDRAITAGAWTRILHIPSGTSVRLGFLPGDVNGNGHTSPDDILALIDSLNGVTIRPSWATDMNRSGVAEPSDILRLIDLLNGAGEFESWNDRSLP